MNAAFFIFTVCVACPPFHSAQADPLRFPHRTIDYKQADLTPLFNWWTNQPSGSNVTAVSRPLSAWVRITGTNSATTAFGWIINAIIEDQPGSAQAAKILLKNPPDADRRTYERISARLNAIQRERESVYIVMTNDAMVGGVYAERAYALSDSDHHRENYYETAIPRLQRASDASERISALDAETERLKRELARYRYVQTPFYIVDFFALRTGQTYKGLPVYDLGVLREPE